MMIFKILRAAEFAELDRRGESDGAPVDRADGFVHFSTAEQLAETAARHFAGEDDLVLAAVAVEPLAPALKWEPSRGGALFPHLYRRLRRSDLAWVVPLPLGPDGAHIIPDLDA
ncbi:MAG: DUF952 domain-containing protein [Rhodobacteraceae bacterium]|nr:DUF952 domain-containing protein [Paracoccaceae bacterium]